MPRVTVRLVLAIALATLAGCAGGWRNGAPPWEQATAPAAGTTTAAAAAVSADGVKFVYKGEAKSVALAGEFNSWSTSADPLTKQADGTWTLTKKLPPGKYPYKFVIDGGTWKTDDNAKETVDDGYGGKNSLVVVAGATAAAAPAAGAMAVPAASGDGVRFVYKGEAKTVALAGEFNSWNTSADPLTQQADGTWTLTKKLPPGKYPYKFVIDGGTWKADDNAKETVDDGYGGKNSIVVVAGDAAAPAVAVAAGAAVAVTGAAKPPLAGADGVTFTYAGPANSVGLAGDFNAWSVTADPMTRQADGTWTITRKLAAGAHSYKFIVDGTNWKTDTANPDAQDDGFGGKNSLVTVK